MRALFLRLGNSFRFRLLAACLLVGTAVLLLLLANGVRLVEQHLVAQAEARSAAMRMAYRTAVVAPLVSGDGSRLREMLEGWQAAEDVRYIAVFDARGQEIARAGERPGRPESGAGRPESAPVRVPVQWAGQQLGEVEFALATGFVEQAKRQLLTQGMLIGLGGFLLALVLLSVVIFYLTRKLVLLAEASRRFGEGDFSCRLPVAGDDEIARLTRCFNAMGEAIEGRIAALSESERRFRAIADYTYAWESWFGPDGALCWVNPAVERMTGYSPAACLALDDFPLPLVHPDDRPLLEAQRRQALAGECGQDLEFRVCARDGRIFWAAMAWQPIQDEQGAALGYRTSVRDISAQHRASEELAFQASHDPLTGLYNRRAFEHHLQTCLDAAREDRLPVVMFYLDLDQFKVVNDTCGHVAGDDLLVKLARSLRRRVPLAFFARLGGDEFGLIMRDCNEAEALRRADRLIEDVRSYRFDFDGHSFRLGASIGVVRAGPGLEHVTDVLMAADAACYAAKERGRNRAELYRVDDDFFRRRQEEFASIARVNNALTEGRFSLYFQRLIPLGRDDMPDAEILLRLHERDGRIVSPAQFIPAAERINLMPHIDRWVVQTLCAWLALCEREHCQVPIGRFGINVSGASLSDPDFPGFVRDQLLRHGVPPHRLCFELTESCAVGQIDQAIRFIDAMHGLGAALALDDFGTGLSSFAYLRQFRVDYLKIDGQFVRHVNEDVRDRAVVEAMVQLARAHGLQTIAEFVSSEAVLETVKALGVDFAQGYARHVPEPLTVLMGE